MTDVKSNIIVEIHKHLKSWEKIEINAAGDIFVCHKDLKTNKTKKNKVANLYSAASENVYPYNGELFRTKSFVNINNPGIKRYNGFGKKLPKREIKRNYDRDGLLSVFKLFLDIENQIPTFYTNTDGLSYIVYNVNGIDGYFYKTSGTLRWIEYKNKRYYISQLFPELETQIIKKLENKE